MRRTRDAAGNASLTRLVLPLIILLLWRPEVFAFQVSVPWSSHDPESRRIASITPLPFFFYSQFFR
jgi:hypothetical protein